MHIKNVRGNDKNILTGLDLQVLLKESQKCKHTKY